MMTKPAPQQSLLQLYWYEIGPSDSSKMKWAQLMGSIHRLSDLREEMTNASRHRDVVRCLNRIIMIVESYLHRAYELRERAVNLFGAFTGQADLARSAKKPSTRLQCLNKLRHAHNDLVGKFCRLLDLLDDDMLLRNMHTHEQFLRVGLCVGHCPYEPFDVLTEYEHNPAKYREMASMIKVEIRKLTIEYQTRIRYLTDAAMQVATAADPDQNPPNACASNSASQS